MVLLGRIAVLRMQMRPIVTDRVAWYVGRSVGLSVCRSVTLLSPATWRIRLSHPSVAAMRSYVKLL